MNLDEKRALRTTFMRVLYELVDGNEGTRVNASDIFEAAGLPMPGEEGDELGGLLRYLEGEYLIDVDWTFGRDQLLRLTHLGAVEIERLIDNPDQPTEHFTPLALIHIEGGIHKRQCLR